MKALEWRILFAHVLVVFGYLFITSHISAYSSIVPTYEEARTARLMYGHDAAVPLYQRILAQNPKDMTAATRIAASTSTPYRQDRACSIENDDDLQHFKQVLNASHYNNKRIQQLFGIREGKLGFESQGPLFVRPVTAGSTLTPPVLNLDPLDERIDDSSFICLMTLFLLGFAGM